MYFYHAHALALGGTIERPAQEILGTSVDSSLDSNRGSTSAETKKYNFKDIVSFDSATSDFEWKKELRNDVEVCRAGASVVIEGLNIFNVFTADRIVARIAYEHTLAESAEPRITAISSHFENLRIAGQAVEVEYATESCHDENLNEVSIAWPARQIKVGHGDFKICSFIKTVHGIEHNHEIKIRYHDRGPVIIVPRFGKIYLGEIIASPHHRAVNMFRLELDRPEPGLISGGSLMASSQATSFPPGYNDHFVLPKYAPDTYTETKARYEFLIDQKYLSGLSANENEELRYLESTLSKADEPFYDDIIRRLRSLPLKEDTPS